VLHGRYVVHVADSPAKALEMAPELSDLAVVVSDMRMPGMDGATLLKEMRGLVPDATRVLLTGYTGVEAAVAAINEGAIFRFLWKPCQPDVLVSCLQDAVTQHRLITAERELLERTLRGSVRALLETLSLANPIAFSRAERIRARVTTILQQLETGDRWDIEVAAMLSQLGAITLSPTVIESLHEGDRLPPAVQAQVDRLPTVSAELLSEVPRLEDVRQTILLQDQRFDGRGGGPTGEQIPLGARILRVAIDYDAFEARREPARDAIAELRRESGRYDPSVLDALEVVVTTDESDRQIEQIALADLRSGMVLASDLVADGGVLLCGRGQEITQRIVDRVRNWAEHYTIVEPISVLYGDASAGGDGA
jgi:response regulator RpfG family c-di-GMP phosphodiesterase